MLAGTCHKASRRFVKHNNRYLSSATCVHEERRKRKGERETEIETERSEKKKRSKTEKEKWEEEGEGEEMERETDPWHLIRSGKRRQRRFNCKQTRE